MEFLTRLIKETEYLTMLKRLENIEQKRRFCRHGLSHLLDTARIAWIVCMEKGCVSLEKEDIYLAALLHDLGRIQEYEEGIPHQEAGAELAEKLLQGIGYPAEKCGVITAAIRGHRSKIKPANALAELLQYADKQSRNCFFCEVQADCKWSQEKRNMTIIY